MEKTMTISCEEFDQLLLEGDAASLLVAEQHAQDCAACLERLDDWSEISAVAQTMRAEWSSDTLWPRIRRELQLAPPPQRVYANWFRVAAAILITVALGASAWYVAHLRSQREFDRDILRLAVLDEVQRAEESHEKAIAQLEKLAEAKLDEADAPAITTYKEKLMLLDTAIAECQSAIDRNRQNAYLRKQLLAMYSEKQQTLREVLREENTNVTNR
ncbi:MAG TPA: hypothetical protein VFN10_24005 [Thermoanaerobaculia bacterium]|nr:hypothetical protein [Thermoanaerobaculia bacterium]